jgi:cation:H+ antiporter
VSLLQGSIETLILGTDMLLLWIVLVGVGVASIVWGSEVFADHLGAAAVRLNVSSFALALLLAGAEPEELATAVTASLRDAPAIAFGDVVGANIAICCVALGVGALVAPLPFSWRVIRYALFGFPIGAIAALFIWDGTVDRLQGVLSIGLYIVYVSVIWWAERRPPALGETGELAEAAEEFAVERARGIRHWVGKDLLLVLAGLMGIVLGSILLVEAVRHISQIEETQTKLGVTLVGFATAFELVVLAWSTARRGATDAAVAGVVGSFTYNVTMTSGVAAVVHPLKILNASLLHFPLLAMLGALAFSTLLAVPKRSLNRVAGRILVAAYLLFVAILMAV